MNKRHNENYFKKTDIILYIGAVMLLAGGILLTVGKRRWVAPCCILMAIGAVIFIIGTTVRSNEKEMMAILTKKLEGMDMSFDTLGVPERRVLRDVKPIIIENYEYDETVMLRQGKNATISSKYTKAFIFTLTDGFLVRTRTVSLISDEDRNKRIEIPFDSISDISVIREDKKLNFNKKDFDITTDRLVIKYGNGYKISIPMHVDITSKDLADKLNKVVKEYKEKNTVSE
ncbi:MAG: hypothetical protein IKC74_04845 [Clostridia bacterium]|nr:hypothetical protein [Clostridia bacterium]